MSQPAKYDISTYQGDTFQLTFYIDGDHSGDTLELQIRVTPASSSPFLTVLDAAMTKIYDVGEDKTLVQCPISAATMATISAFTIYAYDFQSTASGIVTTWLYGSFSVTAEVTR